MEQKKDYFSCIAIAVQMRYGNSNGSFVPKVKKLEGLGFSNLKMKIIVINACI